MTAADKVEKVEDVEMKDAGEEEKVEKKDPNLLSVEDIREHCKLIRRSVETKETRYEGFYLSANIGTAKATFNFGLNVHKSWYFLQL